MATNNGAAKAAPKATSTTVESVSDAFAKRIDTNAAAIRSAYDHADKERTTGGFTAICQASEALAMTPQELVAWVKPSKEAIKKNDISPMEVAIRAAHHRIAPNHSPLGREELRELIGLASRSSSTTIVDEVRKSLGRKNFPSNTSITDAERKDAQAKLKAKAEAPDPTGRNELTIARRAFEAIDDAQKLARLDRELNALQVKGTSWRASLLLPFVGDTIRQTCEDHHLAPVSVWDKAALAAGSAHNKVSAEDTDRTKKPEEYITAMRAAAKLAVENMVEKRDTTKAKPVVSELEQHTAALANVFRGLKALHKMEKLDEADFTYLIGHLTARCGFVDQDKLDEQAKEAARQNQRMAAAAARKAATVLVPKAEDTLPAPTAPVVQVPEAEAAQAAVAVAAGKVAKAGKKGTRFSTPAPSASAPSTADVLQALEDEA